MKRRTCITDTSHAKAIAVEGHLALIGQLAAFHFLQSVYVQLPHLND